MSNLEITNNQNNNQAQEKPHERFIPYDVTIDYSLIGTADLTNGEFRAYCAILGYGKKHGHLSLSTKSFLEDNPVFEERQFRRYCEELQNKGYLYRIQHPLHHKGSMRYLIPQAYYDRFILYILKKYKNAAYAAKVKTFFEGGDEKSFEDAYKSQLSKTAAIIKTPRVSFVSKSIPNVERSKMSVPVGAVKNVRSINNTSIIKERENNRQGNLLPAFEDQLKKEMVKSKLDSKKALELYKTCKKEYDSYDNPIAGIAKALREGYADGKIRKAKEQKEKDTHSSEEKERRVQRKQKAKEISHKLKKRIQQNQASHLSVDIGDHHCNIYLSGTGSIANFDFGDPNCIESLRKFAQKHNVKITEEKE